MALNSIRARMTLAFALSNALLMLLVCGGIAFYARHTASRQVTALLNSSARRIQDELSETNDPAEVVRERGEDLRADGLALLLVDSQGQIRQQSQRHVPTWPRQARDGWRIVTLPAGKGTLVIGYPWAQTEVALRRQAFALTGLGLVVVLASAVGAWLLVGRTLSPIGALSRQAQLASSESLRVQLVAPSRDAEVVELVAMWNDLLARLAETAAQKGRFYAAASHELRTPLQALSGHLEVALSRSRSPSEYQDVLDEAYLQTRRLTSLTQDLLLLNRLETATTPPPIQRVDIADVCERLLSQFRPLARERGLTIQTEFPPEASIYAPPLHVEMLLRNLLENAIKYATSGGEVHVLFTSEETRLEIVNAFSAETLLDAERLFEPFFRPDAARHSETGGNGLGLAICKALAVTNGWQLKLHQDTHSVRVTVLFSSSTF